MSICRARSTRSSRETGAKEVTLLGYCLGGVLAFLYANGHQDAPVRNLVLLATPVDYSEMGPMVAALVEGRLDADDLVDGTGNVPADVLYSGFYMMAPTTALAQNATLLENLWNDEFVKGFQAVAQWTRDQVPFPGAAFRQMVDELIRRNVLMEGSWRLGGREIDFTDDERDGAQRDGLRRPSRATRGRRARRRARGPRRSAARRWSSRAGTPRSARAARRSSTHCRGWRNGSARTATHVPRRKGSHGDQTPRAR